MKMSFYALMAGLLIITACKKDKIPEPKVSVQIEGKFNDLCCNSDNEIVLIGSNDDFQPPEFCNDFIIVKTDQDGNPIWDKKYIFDLLVEPKKILYTGENEYFIAINNFFDDPNWTLTHGIIILKINESGEIISQNLLKLFGGLIYRDMILSQDGGVFVAGKALGYENQGVLVKINSSGVTDYINQYPFSFVNLVQYSTGGLGLLEMWHHNDDSIGASLHITDPVGNELVQGKLSLEADDISIYLAEDPGYLVSSIRHESSLSLIKSDYNSHIDWSTPYEMVNAGSAELWGVKKIGAHYFAFGKYGAYAGTFYFVRFDEFGKNELTFRTPLYRYSFIEEIQFTELNNGRIALIQPHESSEYCFYPNCYSLQIFY
jgi:hypothetical protein